MENSFTTDRLMLNVLTEDDYGFLFRLVNSKGWIEFIGDRNVHSEEDAIAYISKILGSENVCYWVVRGKDENIPIGIISFIKRAHLDNFDIGFAFLPEFTGQGYAYEAARKILSVLDSTPGYNPVLAATLPGNARSIKLLIRLGFHFERELETGNVKSHLYTNAKN